MRFSFAKLINEHLEQVYSTGQTFLNLKNKLDTHLESQKITEGNLRLLYKTYATFYYGSNHHSFLKFATGSRPYWQYFIIDQCEHELCNYMHNRIIKYDNPLWSKIYPPNHPGCSGYIRALNGGDFINRPHLVINEESIPVKPSPGWDFNPATTDWNDFFIEFILETIE